MRGIIDPRETPHAHTHHTLLKAHLRLDTGRHVDAIPGYVELCLAARCNLICKRTSFGEELGQHGGEGQRRHDVERRLECFTPATTNVSRKIDQLYSMVPLSQRSAELQGSCLVGRKEHEGQLKLVTKQFICWLARVGHGEVHRGRRTTTSHSKRTGCDTLIPPQRHGIFLRTSVRSVPIRCCDKLVRDEGFDAGFTWTAQLVETKVFASRGS